jgi:hypothetical protein
MKSSKTAAKPSAAAQSPLDCWLGCPQLRLSQFNDDQVPQLLTVMALVWDAPIAGAACLSLTCVAAITSSAISTWRAP